MEWTSLTTWTLWVVGAALVVLARALSHVLRPLAISLSVILLVRLGESNVPEATAGLARVLSANRQHGRRTRRGPRR